MFFCLLADGLFLLADFSHFFSEFEGVGDNLSEGFLVELRLLGQFEVVVSDSLLEDPWNLFENLCKILLELGSEVLKEVLDLLFDLFPVYLLQILVDLAVDPWYHFL